MRYILYIVSNFAVMGVILFVVNVFGLDRFLVEDGISLTQLALFSLVIGFSGSIVSLLMSKKMAKISMRVKIIETPNDEVEKWLVDVVKKLANEAKIGMPEVGIFEGAPNAFATGATKNSSLVAVSTGLMQSMNPDEVRAVLAHEVAHIANGDMVTMALLQGVLNTFVVFLSRVIAYVVAAALKGNRGINMMVYRLVAIALDVGLGFVAHMIAAYFSRQREFRADAGATKYMNNNPAHMIAALQRLKSPDKSEQLPASMQALAINGGISRLFSTHPPLDDRIAALRKSSGIM